MCRTPPGPSGSCFCGCFIPLHVSCPCLSPRQMTGLQRIAKYVKAMSFRAEREISDRRHVSARPRSLAPARGYPVRDDTLRPSSIPQYALNTGESQKIEQIAHGPQDHIAEKLTPRSGRYNLVRIAKGSAPCVAFGLHIIVRVGLVPTRRWTAYAPGWAQPLLRPVSDPYMRNRSRGSARTADNPGIVRHDWAGVDDK